MRQTTFLFILLAAVLSLALFTIKYQVQDLEQEFAELNRSITTDRQSIHVLEAEWSHLNDLPRLRGLADRYLDLEPVQPEQFAALADLPLPSAQPDGIGEVAFTETRPRPTTIPLADRKESQ